MQRLQLEIDPYENDPGHWGASLLTLAELIVAVLDAAAPRSIVEVGAYAGDLTRLLADWAAPSGARVSAIDPSPQPELQALAAERPDVELVRETSHAALGRIELPDAVVIDGDHNYYTVSEELRLIAERAGDARLPLLLFHDVAWPHARRDDYYDPELVPPAHRQPIAEGIGVYPGMSENRPGGLPYRYPADHEGGPRNGVLTAIEDFVETRPELRLDVVPAFFGFGVAYSESAPYASALAEVLEPWAGNPLLERLEANRVLHLASSHFQMTEAAKAGARLARQEAVLRRLLESSAFALAEQLSRVRYKAGVGTEHSVISREEIRRALGEID
jgi:hypothetical protein